MQVLAYTDVMEEKINNRKNIENLKYDVHGHCIHVGDISYACKGCFDRTLYGGGIQVGQECMANCPMCYYDPNRKDVNHEKNVANMLGDFYELLHDNSRIPYSYSYQSSGETLKYINDLEKFAFIFKEMEKRKNCNIYHHLYTNGILANKEMLKRLWDMEVDEIRFHVSASNFSKSVINNMYEAAKMGFIVTIEEPAWPLHKEQLFNILPIFEDVGGAHLNIVEVQVTQYNIDNIDRCYAHDETMGIYKDYFWHLYDRGLVYEIMREVVDKKYSFSILDCNSGVERCRHAKMQHVFTHPMLYKNGFAEYTKFNRKEGN